MTGSSKKVLFVVAGGSFFGWNPQDGQVVQLPSDDDLRERLEVEIAAHLIKDNIHPSVEIIGRDTTGANQTAEDFNKIGAVIAEKYHDYDGFVVMHGGDTIPWAASHLAFGFENLAKTIVFTDSRVNSIRQSEIASTQALITSAILAAYTNIPEVTVLSSLGQLVKGVDAILLNAGIHAGFTSRNGKVLATIGKEIEIKPHNILPIPTEPMIYTPMDPSLDVSFYQANPISPIPLTILIDDKLGGLVIEAPGFGNVALNKGDMREALQEAQERKIPVVVVTECIDGHVNFSYTDHSGELKELGLVGGGSMTTPAALAKLGALLSRQVPYDQIEEAMATDMRGETMSHPVILQVPEKTVGEPTAQP